MNFTQLTMVFFILVLASGLLGWRRIRMPQLADGARPRSRAVYHGLYNALWCALPMLVIGFAWLTVEPVIIQTEVLDKYNANSAVISEHSDFKYIEIRNIAAGAT